ncbi:bifunctional adenosylcobinamide kinase/adenosylcobinamide-phosphate guanylyltransferase [Corynebacterium felinum]|uniref:Adenosylcobinamide kinase n=1 Tax=Corynebacterium felinum TaxID=131318 RepID=A0ABU2BC61_9CORY|nr:bifunctional adenosylcobinamide kinase/adenosylcobinamide-phosphate guanylyltransferase [Corynebacterium felinum]MDF5820397.1 bifunctional adenosylcobinamide kinase/adenosylcobinamide-phosphate guanylyltransferase [Corynebacterium felinum]MDR7356178.1 adenosylcobinamide kinase/adenosylcobinamide-phosphate guanylyltransferase [Corynebacterium felinum]WJY95512.1 Bifunctional adenosylcobalamin biosynthesis protein CobP [Corynebacterium felinum]
MRTLVLGGARSGKSAFAEDLIGPGPCVYVATARPWPGDEDFAARISHHVARRPAHWVTEDSVDAVELLRDPPGGAVMVDDVGTWLTHVIDREQAWELPRGSVSPVCASLVDAVNRFPDAQDLVLVTPEVGLGVIPEHYSGRLFRDELGALNAQLADVCERVVLVIAGQALVLKDV